jgi:polygalacturonase
MAMRSRRDLLAMGCTGGMMTMLMKAPALAQTAGRGGRPDGTMDVRNVISLGARGDGNTDETAIFQRALDAARVC